MKFLEYTGLEAFYKRLLKLFDKKQDTLVSGNNIKTVNGESLLGSGNIKVATSSTVSLADINVTASASEDTRASASVVKDGNTLKFSFGIPKGEKGDKGDTGSSGSATETEVRQIFFIYKNFDTMPDYEVKSPTGGGYTKENGLVPPSGWDKEAKDNKVVYQSSAIIDITNCKILTSWSTPFRITGKDGDSSGGSGGAGVDGKGYEYIYQRVKGYDDTLSTPSSNKDEDGYVPEDEGWTDHPQGVSEEYKKEYVCQRIKTNGHWGSWSEAVQWAVYGKQGTDGDGIEYIFFLTQTNTAPSVPKHDSTEDDYKPVDTATGRSWTDNPTGPDGKNYFYEWVVTRKMKDGVWDNFYGVDGKTSEEKGAAALWSMYTTVDGTISVPVTIFIYCATSTTPNTPTGGTYNPDTLKLNACPSGWQQELPDLASTSVVWTTSAVFNSSTGEMISSGWGSPTRLTGVNTSGGSGGTGSDTEGMEFIFKGADAVPPDWLATDNPTSPDSDGAVPSSDGWYGSPSEIEMDGTTIKAIYFRYRVKTDGSWGEWSKAQPWAVWGEKGQDGDGVEYIFKRTTTESAPTVPMDLTNTNGSSLADDDFVPNGWTDNPTGVNSTYICEWVCQRKKKDGTWQAFTGNKVPILGSSSSTLIKYNFVAALWAKYSKDVEGTEGVGVQYIFYLSTSSSEPSLKEINSDTGTSSFQSDTHCPTGWYSEPQAVSAEYPYEYIAQRTKVKGTWGEYTGGHLYLRYSSDGTSGPIPYPAGIYDSSTEYSSTDKSTPYVYYNGEYYVLLEGKTWPAGGSADLGTNPESNCTTTGENKYWEKLKKFGAIYTNLAIVENGTIGSSVYNGNYMFSKQGVWGELQSEASDSYKYFDPNTLELGKEQCWCKVEKESDLPVWISYSGISTIEDVSSNTTTPGINVGFYIYATGTNKIYKKIKETSGSTDSVGNYEVQDPTSVPRFVLPIGYKGTCIRYVYNKDTEKYSNIDNLQTVTSDGVTYSCGTKPIILVMSDANGNTGPWIYEIKNEDSTEVEKKNFYWGKKLDSSGNAVKATFQPNTYINFQSGLLYSSNFKTKSLITRFKTILTQENLKDYITDYYYTALDSSTGKYITVTAKRILLEKVGNWIEFQGFWTDYSFIMPLAKGFGYTSENKASFTISAEAEYMRQFLGQKVSLYNNSNHTITIKKCVTITISGNALKPINKLTSKDVELCPGAWIILECKTLRSSETNENTNVTTNEEYLCWVDVTDETTGYTSLNLKQSFTGAGTTDNKYMLIDPDITLNNGLTGGTTSGNIPYQSTMGI